MKEIRYEADHEGATGGFKVIDDTGEWMFSVRFIPRQQKWYAWANRFHIDFRDVYFDTEEEARGYAYAQIVKRRMKK